MQKRILGLIGIIVLWSNLAEASIVSLPRYTGDISSRYNEANIGKTEKLSCAERGKVDKPSDSCQKCVNEYAGCCDYIECSTASNCYKYTSARREGLTGLSVINKRVSIIFFTSSVVSTSCVWFWLSCVSIIKRPPHA